MVRPSTDRRVTDRWRSVLLAIALATLVAAAGCSGLAQPNDQPNESTTAAPEPTTSAPPEPTTDAGTTTEPAEDATGKLTILVSDAEVTREADTATFEYDPSANHAWNASEGTTLAEGLATLDVDARPDELTYDGRTYRESDDETTVVYRVNGDPVDPTEYALQDDDEVWVIVETPDTDREPPGEYIPDSDHHIHGHLRVIVDGHEVNFDQEKYYSNDRYFHYHDGEGGAWHGHSSSITLAYALSTFEGIEVTDDSLTYEGTTYDADDSDTTISVEVNGEPVTPSEYYIKDWDGISVVVTTDS